jgi:hypothetical protein
MKTSHSYIRIAKNSPWLSNLLWILIFAFLPALSLHAQDTLRPLKAGNPQFSESQLKPEVRIWYARLWAAIKNPGYADPDPDAKSGDNYKIGRPFEMHVTALLQAYRLTGDLKLMDEVDRLMQIARNQLRDAWDNGQKDGFISWRNYSADVPNSDKGKDLKREIDEILSASMVAEVAWAFRVNQNVTSPKGISYRERADFWQNFLSNHFEAKWRKRENKKTGFPFLVKNLQHIYVAFIRYHYYMSKLTGRADYMNEAQRMAGIVAKNICVISTPSGSNYVWPHAVYFDVKTNSDALKSSVTATMTTYVRHAFASITALSMEGFAQFADPKVMRQYAGGYRDFMIDGKDTKLELARSISGDVSRTGIITGTGKSITIRVMSATGSYVRKPASYIKSCQMPLMAVWDSTGKLFRFNEKVHMSQHPSYLEDPRNVFIPVGMMWHGHVKSSNTIPYPPSHLTAKSGVAIELSWTDNSSDETGFRIERSLDKASWTVVGSVSANIRTYVDSALKSNTRYYYRMRAINSAGTSLPWNIANATTKKTAPAAPTELSALIKSSTRNDLSWKDNSDSESSFKIERSRDGGTFSQIASVGADITRFSDANVVSGRSYRYRVRAANSVGSSAYSNIATPSTSTVANQPPAVSIQSTSSSTLTAPASISLTATASDSDGSIAKVEFFNGSTRIGTDSSSPYAMSWTNVAAGTHSLTAKAIDNQGASTVSAPITIMVNAPNKAPTISLSSSSTATSLVAPATINLSATASDSDGSIAKVEFFNGSTRIGADSSSPYAMTWSDVAAGTYPLTAKAIDNQGASTVSAPITITVNAPNKAPTVSLSSPSTATSLVAPATISLNATAADSDGSIAKVVFFDGSVKIGTDTSSPYAMSWTNIAAGTYSLTAKAIDNQGASGTSAVLTVTVEDPNQKPTVTLTSPADGSTLLTSGVRLTAKASDGDGSISKVEFYANGTLIHTENYKPYEYTPNPFPTGTHTIMARAYDNLGAWTDSASVSITVVQPTATLISGSSSGQSADAAIVQRLQSLGFTVNIKSASTVSSADVAGSQLVLISSTTDSTSLGQRLRDVSIPVICWEPYLFDDMGMTGLLLDTDYGWASQGTSVSMLDSSHPLAAGLAGAITLTSSSVRMPWGKPADSAIKIGIAGSQTGKISIFAYEAGAAMTTLTAPARRVAFSLSDDAANVLTLQGWQLFDAAVQWATAR